MTAKWSSWTPSLWWLRSTRRSLTPPSLERFLNFDFDVDEKSIFERIIEYLPKIANGKYAASERSGMIQIPQERDLRGLALNGLLKFVRTVVDWAMNMTDEQLSDYAC